MLNTSYLKCRECSTTYPFNPIRYKCSCGGNLEIHFSKPLKLIPEDKPGIWKFSQMLPPESRNQPITLYEGNTPIVNPKNLSKTLKLPNLLLKDETRNPTGSFMDRGSSVLISTLKNLGIKEVVSLTTGNFSASISAYAAKAGIKYTAYALPIIDLGKLFQSIAFGAKIKLISNPRKIKEKLQNKNYISPLNPLFIEGIKTISYEILLQTKVDVIIVPMGNGALIHSIWLGFKTIVQKQLPKLIGVQPKACNPITTAIKNNSNTPAKIKPRKTIATDVAIPNPAYGKEAIKAIKESNGTAIDVSDNEILKGGILLARAEGLFVEPSAALTIAALKKLLENKEINRDDKILCILTGSGLKSPSFITSSLSKHSRIRRVISTKKPIPHRISTTKTLILKVVKKKPGITGYRLKAALAEEGMSLSLPTIYLHLKDLTDLGLLKYEEKGRKRKSKAYYLTEKGIKLIRQIS